MDMLKRFLLVVVIMLLAAPALAAYSYVIEDLPLMPGMAEKSDTAIVFENPGARVLETTLKIKASPEAVAKFYSETLPQLGWTENSPRRFIRESEELEISMERAGEDTVVCISVAPLSGEAPE
jgi:hypothetical protein